MGEDFRHHLVQILLMFQSEDMRVLKVLEPKCLESYCIYYLPTNDFDFILALVCVIPYFLLPLHCFIILLESIPFNLSLSSEFAITRNLNPDS